MLLMYFAQVEQLLSCDTDFLRLGQNLRIVRSASTVDQLGAH